MTVRVWDLASGRPVGQPLWIHEEEVRSVALGELEGPRRDRLRNSDQTVRVWDSAWHWFYSEDRRLRSP